mmetsp:Transcript_6167/g.15814  ORF Transcript_6167/g.15814 Transcript_6167/m.15814 type:complete len:98 (+) Transcript_6167:2-295(+)
MDFRGRPCLVVSACRGGVRRQTELSDAELGALWGMAAQASAHHGSFEDMRINAGTFQNIAQLHLKIFIDAERFQEVWRESPVYAALREAQQARKASG